MTSSSVYADGVAVWAAVTARAKATARAAGTDNAALVRRLVFSRFLARVFHDPAAPWVLKGGTAVLARVHDARTTKDVDLLSQLSSLDAAVDALRALVARDLGDHFRFVISSVGPTLGGAEQPGVDGCRVGIDAYCGTAKRGSFGVDLVTGSLMTSAPELVADPVLDLRGITAPLMRLYPVVDHVADKLCATQAMYGTERDRASSRVRDLVDLVVLAGTQDMDGFSLTAAVRGEWTRRGLPGEPVFAPPAVWEHLYPTLARKVPACSGAVTFDEAVEAVGSLLAPVLAGEAMNHRWSSADHAWSWCPRS